MDYGMYDYDEIPNQEFQKSSSAPCLRIILELDGRSRPSLLELIRRRRGGRRKVGGFADFGLMYIDYTIRINGMNGLNE